MIVLSEKEKNIIQQINKIENKDKGFDSDDIKSILSNENKMLSDFDLLFIFGL